MITRFSAKLKAASLSTGKLPAAASQIAIALLLLGFPILYFLPAIKGEIILAMGDSWSYSILMRMLLGSMLSQRMLPLWNIHIFAGMPLMAAVQPGVFYPPNWLFVVLPPGAAINLIVITTYHIALLGTYLYMRVIGMSRAASLLSGVAFTFGGFMIAHLEQVNYIAAAAWLPWILLVIEKLSRSSSWNQSWKWVTIGAITAKIIKRRPDGMQINSRVTRPSLLVLSELYFPGWNAKVDGRDVEILCVDYLLRGIQLSPGSHTVEVFYWPRTLTIGAGVSALTLFLVLFAIVGGQRQWPAMLVSRKNAKA